MWDLSVNHLLIRYKPPFNQGVADHALACWIGHFSFGAVKRNSFAASDHEGHVFVWLDDALVDGLGHVLKSCLHRSDWLPHEVVVLFGFSVKGNGEEVVVLGEGLVFTIEDTVNLLKLVFPGGFGVLFSVELGIFFAHEGSGVVFESLNVIGQGSESINVKSIGVLLA